MGHSRIRHLTVWWDANAAHPDFFEKLGIAHDGGLSEVRSLFVMTRFLWAGINIGCLMLNVSILGISIMVALKDRPWVRDKDRHFSFVNGVAFVWMDKEVKLSVYIAFIEIVGLAVLVGKCVQCMFQAFLWMTRSPALGWHAVSDLFFQLIPSLASFSSLRLLSTVNPAIFISRLNIEIAGVIARHGEFLAFPVWLFLFSRAVYGVLGLDAFLSKFHEAARNSEENPYSATALVGLAGFLNQMLGVVQVNRYVRWRLMVYIFGGQDGYIDPKEEVRLLAWHAMLANQIWILSKEKVFSRLWFCAVMLSYSDHDFQRLTLNENNKQVLSDALCDDQAWLQSTSSAPAPRSDKGT